MELNTHTEHNHDNPTIRHEEKEFTHSELQEIEIERLQQDLSEQIERTMFWKDKGKEAVEIINEVIDALPGHHTYTRIMLKKIELLEILKY